MDKEKRLTPLKAIRKFCIECQGKSMKEVRLCQNVNCIFWGFRMGHKPKTEKARHYINQEQKHDSKGLFLHKKRIKILSEKGAVAISEAVIVPKKKWDEIQEKLKGEK